MDPKTSTILVTGATGRQGGAVLRHLRTAGWPVRALTRDPNSPTARALTQLGAEVMAGDLDDVASLERALDGVSGVFSVQNFWEHGFQNEVQQGRNLAYAAATAGRVELFVQSSVGGAERHTGIAHFESKRQVEEYVTSLPLPATLLRPAFFMENLSTTLSPSFDGTLRLPMPPARPLQMVAVDDIGGFAALAFARPDEYRGQALELAGDELTMVEVASLLTGALARPVRFEEVPLEAVRPTNVDMAAMFEWFQREGYRADIPALRARYRRLHRFEDWLRERVPSIERHPTP
jgi:uncharacterized protein YbjT (DUF2867 family)